MNEAMSNKSIESGRHAAQGPAQGVRSVVSLVLFIHLFCVFVALSTNNYPSGLAIAFLRVMRCYTQSLNFDLTVPYHLTLAEPVDVDHRVEILPVGGDENDPSAWISLPDSGWRGGERRARYERLGELMDLFVEQDREQQMALLAASVGTHFLRQGVRPKQIRCRRHSLVPIEAYLADGAESRDANAPNYFSVVYAANAIVDDDLQTVEVVKIDAAGQVARPTGAP